MQTVMSIRWQATLPYIDSGIAPKYPQEMCGKYLHEIAEKPLKACLSGADILSPSQQQPKSEIKSFSYAVGPHIPSTQR
jgi:hypothetical protein